MRSFSIVEKTKVNRIKIAKLSTSAAVLPTANPMTVGFASELRALSTLSTRSKDRTNMRSFFRFSIRQSRRMVALFREFYRLGKIFNMSMTCNVQITAQTSYMIKLIHHLGGVRIWQIRERKISVLKLMKRLTTSFFTLLEPRPEAEKDRLFTWSAGAFRSLKVSTARLRRKTSENLKRSAKSKASAKRTLFSFAGNIILGSSTYDYTQNTRNLMEEKETVSNLVIPADIRYTKSNDEGLRKKGIEYG